MTASAEPHAIFRLDHSSPLPRHAHAVHLLRGVIRSRRCQAGGLLPDEVSLSRSLGISRNTLRAAIYDLMKGWPWRTMRG